MLGGIGQLAYGHYRSNTDNDAAYMMEYYVGEQPPAVHAASVRSKVNGFWRN